MSREAFCNTLGYRFQNARLLDEALTHRSFGLPNYERLEFLGDSVLSAAISRALYDRFPLLTEGQLSRLRATLVRQETLHRIALLLGVGAVLRLGEGELKSGGHTRPSILADALEALFGAIALDADYDAAASVIIALYHTELESLDPARVLKDPKTDLQEWLQARRAQLPVYTVLTIAGQSHAQHFEVECDVRDFKLTTRGQGPSRRAAEQAAAALALEKLAS
ncbi:MAG: hypothetical protein RIR70_1399 [Pseudomonadota bacterium]|jgi:ribonuclease-3